MGYSNVLTIRTTPRTGSNLLMMSLAKHPEVRSAGEFYCTDPKRCFAEAWANKKLGNWNLTKTFFLEEPPRAGLTVFLYRRDRDAQLKSYLRACETGEWIQGMFSTPGEPRQDFLEQVEQAYKSVRNTCHMTISYEDLIEHWDEYIDAILRCWGLEPIKLEKVLNKQSP